MKIKFQIVLSAAILFLLTSCDKEDNNNNNNNNGGCTIELEEAKEHYNASGYGTYNCSEFTSVQSVWATYYRSLKQLKIYTSEENKIEFYFPEDVSFCRFEQGSYSVAIADNDTTKCSVYFIRTETGTSGLLGYQRWMKPANMPNSTSGQINLTISNGLISGDFTISTPFTMFGDSTSSAIDSVQYAKTITGTIHEASIVNVP